MVIVDQEQRRAMKFIAVANRGGCRPTGREINQWRLAPEPKPARKGELLQDLVAMQRQLVSDGSFSAVSGSRHD